MAFRKEEHLNIAFIHLIELFFGKEKKTFILPINVATVEPRSSGNAHQLDDG